MVDSHEILEEGLELESLEKTALFRSPQDDT